MNRAAATGFMLGLAWVSLVDGEARAQTTEISATRPWGYVIEPYIFLPNLNATVGVGNLPYASIDQSPSDIFNHLQFAAMLYAEAHNDSWAIGSDFLYINLAVDAAPRPLISYGRADLREILWEPSVMYRVNPWVELGLGAQLTSLDSTLNLTLTTPLGAISRSASKDVTWAIPTANLAATIPLDQHWSLAARGLVGGLGSQFGYDAQVYASYQFTDAFKLSAGYRVIDTQYQSGSGLDRFLYHAKLFGPEIRFAFLF
jgi:hypothetical protein